MQATEFVQDWLCYNTILGEGAYGEVRLLVHKTTEEKLACKIIDYSKYKDAEKSVSREIMIHGMLNHENIIKFYGRRKDGSREYLFLEYAAGGELFQMIEPDIGMPSSSAQRFMKELLAGIQYLHKKGIAHRDVKPENILIDGAGMLKISDFGMATIFRLKGKERLLDKKCGTKPYLAPEVIKSPYKAQPADLWSCGIVFVAMLTGELPWAEPADNNEEFIQWKKDNYISETPWSKLGNTALSMARQILNVEPNKRLTLEQILRHPWMQFTFRSDADCADDTVDGAGDKSAKRWNSTVEAETRQTREMPQVALSQPNSVSRPRSIDQLVDALRKSREGVWFSQPARNDDVWIPFTQSPITKENFGNFVRRLTRFYVACSYEKALERLCSVLDVCHYRWTVDASGAVTVNTVDQMKNLLVFKANLIEMEGKILLDFRLAKGCGIEFKKRFLKLKECLLDIVDKSAM